MNASDWTIFKIYPEHQDCKLMAKYRFEDGELKVNLCFRSTKGLYYSHLNDACEEAERLTKQNQPTK